MKIFHFFNCHIFISEISTILIFLGSALNTYRFTIIIELCLNCHNTFKRDTFQRFDFIFSSLTHFLLATVLEASFRMQEAPIIKK